MIPDPFLDTHISSMSPTVMNSRPEESDEDRDSLFGSPPPSPRRTGTASPTLALPSTGSSASRLSASTAPANKNVGTIALPGSHPDSELPINPLALSLNHGIVQRPPAHVPPTVNTMGPASRQRNNGQQVGSTSQSLINPIGSRSSKPKTKKRTNQPSQPTKELTPRPSGPEFALPDPSAPPPSNFLRNQEKLLGKAGLVAGVNPSTLTHTRGSTPSNPILVNDDDDAPTLGRRKPQSRESSQPYIDPSVLVAPTNEEIVSVLIAQKDIFPILQGVLKLVLGNLSGLNSSTTPPPQPTGFQRRGPPGHAITTNTPSGQPVKKRKLNRVPAGATDWDVPYPFEQGEGPDAYRQNWERERGKQLISQLMKLIKSAARKAATKKYLQQEKERRGAGEKEHHPDSTSKDENNKSRRKSYYKPETATYGIDTSSSTQTPTEGNGTNNMSSQSSNPINATTQQVGSLAVTQQTALEGMLDLQNLPSFSTADLTGFGDLSNHLATSTDLQTPTTFDSALFDNWMTFFTNTFPTSFDGTSSLFVDSAPTSHCSTPGPDDFSFSNLFSQPILGDSTLDLNLSTSVSDLSAMISSILNQPQTSPLDPNSSFPPPPPITDTMIDPSLLALSNPLNLDTTFMESSIAPPNPIVQAASPIPSTSSFSGNDPATPASANWDMSLPDVFMASADGDTSGQGMWRRAMWNNFSSTMAHHGLSSEWNANEHDFGPLPDLAETGSGMYETTTAATASVDKGKGRAMDVDVTSVATDTTTVLEAQEAVRALLESSSTSTNRNPTTSTPLEKARATRKLRKDDIIRRAQEKRDRLQEELNKVKMQLWETTIEQAGLLQLARQLDGVGNVTEGSGSGGRVS